MGNEQSAPKTRGGRLLTLRSNKMNPLIADFCNGWRMCVFHYEDKAIEVCIFHEADPEECYRGWTSEDVITTDHILRCIKQCCDPISVQKTVRIEEPINGGTQGKRFGFKRVDAMEVDSGDEEEETEKKIKKDDANWTFIELEKAPISIASTVPSVYLMREVDNLNFEMAKRARTEVIEDEPRAKRRRTDEGGLPPLLQLLIGMQQRRG